MTMFDIVLYTLFETIRW